MKATREGVMIALVKEIHDNGSTWMVGWWGGDGEEEMG